ncbi:oxidoreductase [Methylomonas albis]|uniref:Oxidoreductase n=1 Tax=Methylomonas albis TaxID=1854563 RepID=A0ABR9CXV4_9GAMM|nr:oxidoreductase [Methylomonas albis]MBD9355714.1 oxidoreductase [Methylomonas albis]
MDIQDFEGLRALLDSTFPKTCASCGYVYISAEQFFIDTQDMPRGRSSLRSAIEDDGLILVEVFRNCRCGSTLMDEFGCRRDHSERGERQRQAFDTILKVLQSKGIAVAVARVEIIKFLQGQPTTLIAMLNIEL